MQEDPALTKNGTISSDYPKIQKIGNIGMVSENGQLFMCLKHRSEVETKFDRNFEKIVNKFRNYLEILEKYADFL